MEKREIESRAEVSLLVHSFYEKVREDDLLGPIFNKIITDWDSHLERLTDFWESNLFFAKKYVGNPMSTHIEVDKKNENKINEMHFGVWLNLWFQTLDEHFTGEKAQLAKNRARSMGTFIHLNMFKTRQSSE